MRRVRTTLAGLVAASLLLAGCGGDDEPASDETPEPTEETSAAPPETWPMTGLEVAGGGTASLKHPVYVAKIDNTSSSAPQVGLDSADLVVEELVEGGITRLAVFFYSDVPGEVGPLRSMRYSDVGIVKPVDGEIVTSGAAPQVVNRMKSEDITFHDLNSEYLARDPERSSLYSVMARLGDLADASKQKAKRPADYLTWGTEADFPGGRKARTISADFGGSHSSEWKYAAGGYQLVNGYTAKGKDFPTDTVLVLRVRTTIADYKDPAGNPVPETHLYGKGEALMFHRGKVVRATWSKDGVEGTVKLRTRAGELSVPAGHVWIELVPAANGDVTFR